MTDDRLSRELKDELPDNVEIGKPSPPDRQRSGGTPPPPPKPPAPPLPATD